MYTVEDYKNEVLGNCTKEVVQRNYPEYMKNDIRIVMTKRRIYGLEPLNEKFKGSHLHHLHVDREGKENHRICIYIPRFVHMDNPHNSVTWMGMDNINKISWAFLDWQKNHMTKCERCKQTKFNIEFSKNNTRENGLQKWCKECSNIQHRIYYTRTRFIKEMKENKIVIENSNRKVKSALENYANALSKLM